MKSSPFSAMAATSWYRAMIYARCAKNAARSKRAKTTSKTAAPAAARRAAVAAAAAAAKTVVAVAPAKRRNLRHWSRHNTGRKAKIRRKAVSRKINGFTSESAPLSSPWNDSRLSSHHSFVPQFSTRRVRFFATFEARKTALNRKKCGLINCCAATYYDSLCDTLNACESPGLGCG